MNRFIYIYGKDRKDYNKIKIKYTKNVYQFHKLHTKIKFINTNRQKVFFIHLIGLDKEIKKKYKTFNVKKILQDLKELPNSEVQKKSLSLYADYNPKTTIKGLGFKNKKKAISTINRIKNLEKKYQLNVINTMINRAKYHPHINKDMREAIKIFENYKNGNNY